ncbi:VPLPA-CTERM sorting domain-containing protein [Methylomonas sp. MgM2]
MNIAIPQASVSLLLRDSFRILALPGLVIATGSFAGNVQAVEFSSGTLNFSTTTPQSIWSEGDAFLFNYNKFIGIDTGSKSLTVNPSQFSRSGYSVDPYFLFSTDLRTGINVGAKVDGGSVNATVSYSAGFSAPDTIVKGQPFNLLGNASLLSSSSFNTQSPNASAWIDGVLDYYAGAYARFDVVQPSILADHDYRMGNKGYTDNNTTNAPYKTLVNIDYTPEIASFNRNNSGVFRVLGIDQGLEYSLGATTISVGPDWSVNAVGAVNGGALLQGSDTGTLLTAEMDVDQLILAGNPALGTGVGFDWGLVDFEMGYELIDVTAGLQMGLQQDFSLQSNLMVDLIFSDWVDLQGIGQTQSYSGLLSDLPAITLLSDIVEVTPTYWVDATLSNDSKLVFDAIFGVDMLDFYISANYDFGVASGGYDRPSNPAYTNRQSLPLFDIGIFNDVFALNGFEKIQGNAFALAAVPIPSALWMMLGGCAAMAGLSKRRRHL